MVRTTDRGAREYAGNEDHLRDELRRIGGIVRAQLLRFRHALPEAHRERFWHLADDYLDDLARDQEHSPLDAFGANGGVAPILAWVEERRTAIERGVAASREVDLRLVRLRDEFLLDTVELDAFLLALLPLLHSTYRRLYGVLQHDPARALASTALLAEMLTSHPGELPARLAVFDDSGALVRHRLVVLGGTDDDPLAFRAVAVDERVMQFILGHDGMDPRLARVARWHEAPPRLRDLPLPLEAANRLEMLPELRASEPEAFERLRLEFSGPDAGLAVRAFGTVSAAVGQPLLVVDTAAVSEGAWPVVIPTALREARLAGAAVMLTGLESQLAEPAGKARFARLLARLDDFPRQAAIEIGTGAGEGRHSARGWLPFHLPLPSLEQREALWTMALADTAVSPASSRQLASDLATAFQLSDSQIRDARLTATSLARRRHVFRATPDRDELYAACRMQSTRQLVAFANRIEPARDLSVDDLVLPPANRTQLLELRTRIRNHGRVYRAMGLSDARPLGRGVTALFVGGSGTGKTRAAEILAAEQHVELYRVDLSALVSKWVGETEKNLSRIFADAEQANCLLFFDEADSLFGQRGEVKEARDRWANLEVNYLLQRIEEYSGVVILATNLRQNIDEAFQRRIHALVEFPMPDAAARREIWRRLLPGPDHATITGPELDELAARFDLSGGSIRNVVLAACYRAMDSVDRKLTIRHLVASTAREYQKAMRPVTLGDFGPEFHAWAMADVIAPAAAGEAN
jgi:hypothetical protein